MSRIFKYIFWFDESQFVILYLNDDSESVLTFF